MWTAEQPSVTLIATRLFDVNGRTMAVLECYRCFSVSTPAVCVASVVDPENDDLVQIVVDAVQNSVGSSASGPDARKIVPELFADPLRVLDQGSRKEVDHGNRHRFWQFARDGSLRGRRDN